MKSSIREISLIYRRAMCVLNAAVTTFIKTSIFISLAVNSPNSSFAQNQKLNFQHLGTEKGLSQSTVTCIFQDSKGFIWCGTFDGLNKYDGYEFRVYKHDPDDRNSISDNYIETITEDVNGNLWIGTHHGLCRYRRSMDNFQCFYHNPLRINSLSNNYIASLLPDSSGNLWIGTGGGGLNVVSGDFTNVYRYLADDEHPNTLTANGIYVVNKDSRGKIWIGSWDGAVDIYDHTKNKFRTLLPNGARITTVAIRAIVEDLNGNIWIGTQGSGLYCVEFDSEEAMTLTHFTASPHIPVGIGSNIILSLMVDRKGVLWIGTEDEGLSCMNVDTKKCIHYKSTPYYDTGLNNRSIWSLFEDNAGNIWIGTFAGGINLITKGKSMFRHFRHYPWNSQSLTNNTVSAFWEESSDLMWIGTDGGGVNLFDRKKEIVTATICTDNSQITSDAILSLYKDTQGILWIGTWVGGLYAYNAETRKIRSYNISDGLASNNIFSITEDGEGRLWVAAYQGGVCYFDRNQRRFNAYTINNSNLTDNQVAVVSIDNKGGIWAGAETGLNYIDIKKQEITTFTYDENDEKSLSRGFVISLLPDNDSTIWVGTTSGLNKFNPRSQTFLRYTVEDGLASEVIKGIVKDDKGRLWLSTNKGLSHFNPVTETFKNYDVEDGLQSNEFFRQSLYMADVGEIFAGGVNGFNVFQPDSIHENLFIPPVVITDFQIFNKPVMIGTQNSPLQKHISEMTELNLSYKHSVFSFEFTALNYILPQKNQYAYMLEGFETSWNYVGTRRTASYTNLDPGEYMFRVKASNNDGIWNETGTSLKIIVAPPIWKTWWAYLCYILITIIIIQAIIRHFVGRARLKTALQLEHLELEKMYELDQMKSRFFTNVSHEFRTPISLIMGPLDPIIKSDQLSPNIKKKLQLIYRNARRLLRMTNQLMDVHKIEAGELLLELSQGNIIGFVRETALSFKDYARTHHIGFSVTSELNSYRAWFDPDKLDKIIYNLLSNAFKFTPDGGRISVLIDIISLKNNSEKAPGEKNSQSKYIQISVCDNGKGIPGDKLEHIFGRFYQVDDQTKQKYQGSGVGLALVYELINLYRGTITVNSVEGEGSTFTIKIPLGMQYLETNQLVGEIVSREVDHPDLLDDTIQDISISLSEYSDNDDSRKEGADAQRVPSILVVDDEQDIIEYITSDLRSKYRFIKAKNGEDGYQKAIEQIPDLIISDIMMPIMNGTDLCVRLKSDEKTSHIPFILLTARSSDENRIRGLEIGADAYVTKPFNMNVLQAHIVNLLKSREQLRQRFSTDFLIGDKKADTTNIDEKFLNRAVEIVREHMENPDFNAEMLSRKIGMSRMQLYRKFRGLTDQTVHEFIRSIRLKAASQMLLRKRITVTEVAFEVGFKDLTYFARCFRQQYGVSPSKFISQQK